jgi:KDO2-lipid IV(A) lauroyltransferase
VAEAPPTEADVSEEPASRPARKRSRTIRDRWWHRALASAFLGLCSAFAWMPSFLAYGLADLMAVPWALFWLVSDPRGRRSRGYHRNLRIVFREGGPMPRPPRGHLWRWSRHMAWLFVDFCRMRRLNKANLARHVDMAEVPQLQALMAEGKGVIVATGHIGMWDVLGHAAGLVGVPLTSVYRPSYVPALDRAIEKLRSGTGQALLLREGAMVPLKQALAEGQMLGLLVDGGGKGSRTFAPFLGTAAATTPSPALLHLVSGAPVAVITCERKGRLRFRVRVWDIVRDGRTGDRRADQQAITARLNRALSAAILAAPEQWFWQNNRFRHRPPGEVPGPDGLPPLAPPD